jgi:hypothetical protein
MSQATGNSSSDTRRTTLHSWRIPGSSLSLPGFASVTTTLFPVDQPRGGTTLGCTFADQGFEHQKSVLRVLLFQSLLRFKFEKNPGRARFILCLCEAAFQQSLAILSARC